LIYYISCILHLNTYFKPYILKLNTLHLFIGSKTVVLYLPENGYKCGWSLSESYCL